MRRSIYQALFGVFSHCVLALLLTTACVKLPRRDAAALDNVSSRHTQTQPATEQPRAPISINRASREELERLPGVGPALAARIVEHRERHGPFRRAEHLLVIRGISERRFRELRPFITADR